MDDLIKQAASELVKAKHSVALTGAGISVESGIPPFRGKGGVWEKINPDFAHIDVFISNPELVWNILIKDMKQIIDQARPNDAHNGLAKLERLGLLKTVITQNVDGLHQMAGNTDVIEFHGNCAWQRCMVCEKKIETYKVSLEVIPPRCTCGGVLRPDWVFFGEMIPHHSLIRSRKIASECDLMLVIGTSAVVQPAAYMPSIAKQNGAIVIEINMEKTHLTDSISDFLIKGSAGEMMNRLVTEVENILSRGIS